MSTIGGAIILWLLIDKITWPYISKNHNIESKKSGSLTIPLGIIERASYTTSLILGFPHWIAIWLAMKVAVGWNTHQTRKSPSQAVPKVPSLNFLHLIFQYKRLIEHLFHGFFSFGTACSDNLYLIGSLISIMFGLLGAWIVMGQLPSFK